MRHAAISALGSSRLSRSTRIGIYTIGIGVWLSGVLWLLFHYFVLHLGPLGPTTSPLEPWWLKLHGAFAFAAIWIFGLQWRVHIPAGWSGGRRRLSGGLLAGFLAWLIVSGYLLYYVGGEQFRSTVSLAHWLIGLAAPIGFLAHRLERQGALFTLKRFCTLNVLGRDVVASEAPEGEASIVQRGSKFGFTHFKPSQRTEAGGPT